MSQYLSTFGYFDLVTDKIYRTVQLIQHKGMKEMHLIKFVNFALLLPILLNLKQFLDLSFEMVLFR